MRPVLNIQRKILIGLLVPAFCLIILTGYSYSNLLLIEQRIEVLGVIDKAELSVMELRRRGKMFLFYGDGADYEAVLASAAEAADLLRVVMTGLVFSEPKDMTGALILRLEQYSDSIETVRNAAQNDDVLLLKSAAHQVSMDLEEDILLLSAAVRERIGMISETLRLQLLAAAFGVAALFAMLGWYITKHVLRPLKVVERTTRQIGEGNFTPVPLRGTRDEIRDLQEAFNTMVCELKKRQEQLVQSQKLSSIGTLSAGIAHQVNNPLNNISLSAQMMRQYGRDPSSPAFRKALDNIEKETERARDIVRGLLDFARRAEFTPRRIRLKTVVNNAVRFACTQLPPGITVRADVPDGCVLHLDPQRMSEALLNIIINGIQAIGEGPGEVVISLEDESPEGMVTLVVADTGAGIEAADLPHIFDPFFTRKEVGKGTGLGLSIGYGIIEECSGRVRVESEPGKGARFFIDLPLADKPEHDAGGDRP